MNQAEIERLAADLARKHRIPETDIVHPEVVMDPFMMEKMKEPNYVPYCFGTDCGRTRRTVYGFKCPTCGNQMNYDMTHYDGNKNVQYVGDAPVPEVALSGFPPVPGEFWAFRQPGQSFGSRHHMKLTPELAQFRAAHAERKAWNDAVEAKKAAKKARKA